MARESTRQKSLAVLTLLASGGAAGLIEALSSWATGSLPLAAWNVAVLGVIGTMGGVIAALPIIAMIMLVRRLPLTIGVVLCFAMPNLISLTTTPLLPLWAPVDSRPWWPLLVWLLLVPGLLVNPSRGLRIALIGVGAALQASHALPAPRPAVDPSAPHLVLITVDGLRWDALDPQGPISRLAERGLRYDEAWAVSPNSVGSNVALLDRYMDGELDYMPPCVPAMTDGPPPPWFFVDSNPSWDGWSRAGFVSSKLLSRPLLHPSVNLDIHDDDFALVQGLSGAWLGRVALVSGLLPTPERRDARYTVDAAIAWVSAHPGAGFVWVHLADPVGPYAPGDPWDKRYAPQGDPRAGTDRMAQARPLPAEHADTLDDIQDPDWVIAQHRGEVAKVEHHLGRLLDALPDHASIVLVGTHGEALGEAGRWFRHGSLRPAELRVPAIIVGPGIAAGRRDPTPTRIDTLIDPVERVSQPWRSDRALTQVKSLGHPDFSGLEVVSSTGDHDTEVLIGLNDGGVLVSHGRGREVVHYGPKGERLGPDDPDRARLTLGRVQNLTSTCAPSQAPVPDPMAERIRRLGGTPTQAR